MLGGFWFWYFLTPFGKMFSLYFKVDKTVLRIRDMRVQKM